MKLEPELGLRRKSVVFRIELRIRQGFLLGSGSGLQF